MNFVDLNTRAVQDILDAEREIRRALEGDVRQYVELLTRLAQALLGDAFDEARRQDPSIPKYWTAHDWSSFFSKLLLTQNLTKSPPDRWNNGNHAEAERLKREIETLRRDNIRLAAELKRLKEAPPSKAQKKPKLKPRPDADQQKSKASPQAKASVPASNPLVGFEIPQQPLAFSKLVKGQKWAPLRWRRGSMLLYLLAVHGINAHIEMDRHIAPLENLSYRTNSTRKPLDMFEESGILEAEVLRIETGITSALRMVRLTQKGRKLCRMLGWEPVQSDWDLLIEKHQGEQMKEHTLAVLLFAMHARARGWQTEVMPVVDGPAQPDIRVSRDGETHYVEVELGKRDRPAKWKNLAKLQGYVALCAADLAGRQRLIGDCKLAKLKGRATDLKTLDVKRIYEITPKEPLWVEEW